MFDPQWLLGLTVALLATNAAAAVAVRRQRRRATAPDEHEEYVDEPEGVVECPDCGTENEPGYRFCRDCVTELPGAMAFDAAGDAPLGRLTR